MRWPCLLVLCFLASPSAFAASCVALKNLRLPKTSVTLSELVPSGSFTPEGGSPLGNLPAFCRVALTLSPSQDSAIRVEVWLPENGWNGRMEGTGNGGFAGKISYGSLASGLRQGYAVANTDMGMAVPAQGDATVFTGRPERWSDWGYRATHEMTVRTKQIIHAFYGRDAEHSYFSGCSTGGEQALMEAQRFPDDYDGIVGGAPAHNRTGVHMSILWDFVSTRRNAESFLPTAKLPVLANAVLAACDARDGVKDGIVADPRKCDFDPQVLLCKGSETSDCLTSAQVETVRRVYAGPSNPHTAKQIYPGVPRGSELGWGAFGPPADATQIPPFAPIFRWVFGRDWDWRMFDFDRDAAQMEKVLSGRLNAVSDNLQKFRSRGHKLIVYHGWADWLVPPEESINYFEAVQQREKGGSRNTDDYFRLFLVPGMQHCGGGTGANQFDALTAVADWVERRAAPSQLIASKPPANAGTATVHRLLCPYPQEAQYSGSGSTEEATNWRCVPASGPKNLGNFSYFGLLAGGVMPHMRAYTTACP